MGNFDQISELLKKYQFEKDPQLKTSLIREICQKMLTNGCHGDCGCYFFFKFIENFTTDANILFTGDNSNCKSLKIIFNVNIVDDNHIDRVEILLLKCPFESHNYDSEVEVISDNGKVCIQFLLVSPSAEFGCTTSNMRGVSVVDHMIGGICQHKLIINGLNQSEEYFNEYSSHQQIGSSQSQSLDFKKIAFDLKALKDEVHEVNQTISDSINETNRTICQLKGELNKMIIDIENINNEQNAENKELKNENIKLKKQIKDLEIIEMGDRTTINNINQEIPDLILWNFPMKLFGSLFYCFDNISHLNTKWAVDSDKFLSNDGQYEVILKLWPRGCSHEHRDSHVCIELLISSLVDSNSVSLLKCRVKLSFGSQALINGEKYLTFFDISPVTSLPQFHVSKSDLKRSDVIENDSLKISCEIFID